MELGFTPLLFVGYWVEGLVDNVYFLRLIQCLLSIIELNGRSSVTMCEVSAISGTL